MVSTRALFLRRVLLPWGTCARPTLVPLVFVFGSAPAQPAARRTRRVLLDYHGTYQLQLASHGTRCRSGADVATVAHPSRLTVRSPPSCRRNRRGNFVRAAYATLLAHGLWPGLYFGGGVYVLHVYHGTRVRRGTYVRTYVRYTSTMGLRGSSVKVPRTTTWSVDVLLYYYLERRRPTVLLL